MEVTAVAKSGEWSQWEENKDSDMERERLGGMEARR